jgi:hypothetical protein
MKLDYIKANGNYYSPQVAGIRDENKTIGNYPVCLIKKLIFGKWQIDYYSERIQWKEKGHETFGDEDIPNTRLIVYPSGIEEIRWLR